ncbi:MAG: hypothetical protein IH995_05720 [Proteobacteria bacterium]|nr:hypothetical protein [Pseudomonadota bacterium]
MFFREKTNRHWGAALLIVSGYGYLNFYAMVSHIENYNIYRWIIVLLALVVSFSLFWELRKDSSFLKLDANYKLFPRVNKNPGVKNLILFVIGFIFILFANLHLFFLMGDLEVGGFVVFVLTAMGTYGLSFLLRIVL